MAKQSRFVRGSMPDVPAHAREPDEDVLSCGHFGPKIEGPRIIRFADLHEDLQEILFRMDDSQVANLKSGLHILVRLEEDDFARVRSFLKLVTMFSTLWKIVKWSTASFAAGLAAVVLAGEQLQKIFGWVLSLIKVARP